MRFKARSIPPWWSIPLHIKQAIVEKYGNEQALRDARRYRRQTI